jgi:hypothetical protein
MKETFEIEHKKGHNVLYCRNRNLEILVIERLDFPKYPDHFLLVFAAINWKNHPQVSRINKEDVVVCFGICPFEEIKYEPYFNHLLVTNAVNEYMAKEWCLAPDEISYSPAYQKAFIDSMTLDPEKMTPELQAYMRRDRSEEPMGFFDWKEKHLKAFLN